MKKKIAIFTVLAVLFTAFAVWARWKTMGLGIYTLNTTVGKVLICTWRPTAMLAIVSWIMSVVYIGAQRKKALSEPKESRAERRARKKAEKKAAKEAAKEVTKEENEEAEKKEVEEPKKNGNFCEKCGAPMKEDQRFCTMCGHEIGKEEA